MGGKVDRNQAPINSTAGGNATNLSPWLLRRILRRERRAARLLRCMEVHQLQPNPIRIVQIELALAVLADLACARRSCRPQAGCPPSSTLVGIIHRLLANRQMIQHAQRRAASCSPESPIPTARSSACIPASRGRREPAGSPSRSCPSIHAAIPVRLEAQAGRDKTYLPSPGRAPGNQHE